MKEAIISVIKDYLKKKMTDYALMINGAWGSGKTVFIKSTLKSEIEKINCPKQKNDDDKKYQQLYVSLYGVSSIEEIKERIFYEVYPKYKWIEFVSSKVVSATEAIPWAGSTIRNLFSFNVKERESIRSAIANYDDKVFFFDDLERIDINKIDIQSVLGYINSLAEHNHYKIVIVANDEVLGDDYKQFKEKTIRFSYNHCPDMTEIFDSVCEKYKAEEDVNYKAFLKEQKHFILDIIRAGECKNIRTLIFITDVFQKIFEESKGIYSNEINEDLLLPFVIISIEAKNGFTKEELKASLQSINALSLSDIITTQDRNEDAQNNPREEFEELLKRKYARFKDNRTISFYDILFNLVYDGYVSQDTLDGVIAKIRNEYHSKEETYEGELVKRIINWTQIPDEDFNNVVNEVNNAVLSKKYNVFDLLRIYAAFVQIEAMKIDDFTLSEDITYSFKSGIDLAMSGQPYLPYFDMTAPLWDEDDVSEAKEKYNEMRRFAFAINLKHKEESNNIQKNRVLDIIKNNETDEFERFMYDINNKSLFVEINPQEIINAVSSANVRTKQVFLWGLSSLFLENLINPTIGDLEYLIEMKTALDNYLH